MPGEKVILILGAQTYLGRVAAETLAGDGHAVYACMPDLCGTYQAQARSLIESAFVRHFDLHVLAFDLPAENHFAPIIDKVHMERGRVDILIDMRCARQVSVVEKKRCIEEIRALVLQDMYKWPGHIAICTNKAGVVWRKARLVAP